MNAKSLLTNIPMQLCFSVVLAVLGAVIIGPIPVLDYFFKMVGGIFIDALKMLVVPLAFVAVTGAVIKMGAAKLRKLSYRFVVLTFVMSFLGFAIGFILLNLVSIPGMEIEHIAVKDASSPTILEFIRNCIPVNPFNSFVKGNMLQILTFSFFIGLAALKVPEKESVIHVFDVMQQILIRIANIIMHIAPLGAFCLLYPVIAKSMTHVMLGYLLVILMMVLGSLLYMVFCSIPCLYLFKVENPIHYFKTIIFQDVIGAIAGGASNYMAPRINLLKAKTGLNHDVIDFFIPITSVLTRMGSTICVGIYTVFAASIFHVSLFWEQIVIAAFLTVIALMCAPGIIGGTLMDCAIIWAAIGIPIEAIAYIAGIDYIIDVLRTVLNIQGGEIITACMNRFSSNLNESEVV